MDDAGYSSISFEDESKIDELGDVEELKQNYLIIDETIQVN